MQGREVLLEQLPRGAWRTLCEWCAEGFPLVFPRGQGGLNCLALMLGCHSGISFE